MAIALEEEIYRHSYLPLPTGQRRSCNTGSVIQCLHDHARHLLLFLLPSFISRQYAHIPKEPPRLSETSFLNGIRGIFACAVFIENFSQPWQYGVDHKYGEGNDRRWIHIPIIRSFYAGPSVTVFFAISGYVISYKFLLHVKNQSHEKLGINISSSIFKRGPRLFIPPLLSSFYVAIATQFGLLKIPDVNTTKCTPRLPRTFNSLSEQIEDFSRFAREDLTNIWNWEKRESSYDANLWTVPIQFRSSMAIFIILLGTAQLRPAFRKYFVVLLFVYWMLEGRWEFATFLGGMFLAERDIERFVKIYRNANHGALGNGSSPIKIFFRNALSALCLLVALYLGSFPQTSAGDTPGFMTLSRISPNHEIWKTYSALLLLYTIGRSPPLHKICLLPTTQYLGKISYAIYLVHGPILLTFGYSLVPYVWRYTGNDTYLKYDGGLGLAFIAVMIAVVFVADLWRRVVEVPCGRLVEWFQTNLFVSIK